MNLSPSQEGWRVSYLIGDGLTMEEKVFLSPEECSIFIDGRTLRKIQKLYWLGRHYEVRFSRNGKWLF